MHISDIRDADLIEEVHDRGRLAFVLLRDGLEEVFFRVGDDGALAERGRSPMSEELRRLFAARDANADLLCDLG